jgi:hypothetical protein
MMGNYAKRERAYSSRKTHIEEHIVDRAWIERITGRPPGTACGVWRIYRRISKEHATSLGRMSDAHFYF